MTRQTIPLTTFKGKIIDINNLTADDIDIEDIAHSLSMICRYNGHCKNFYSVAEHSFRLANYAHKLNLKEEYNRDLAKCLLLHDATEAYVGDIVRAFKETMPQFQEIEDRIFETVFKKFGLWEFYKNIAEAEVKEYDYRICFDEMYALFNEIDPHFYENRVKPLGISIMSSNQDALGWTPAYAKDQFLVAAEFFELYKPEVSRIKKPEAPTPAAKPQLKKGKPNGKNRSV